MKKAEATITKVTEPVLAFNDGLQVSIGNGSNGIIYFTMCGPMCQGKGKTDSQALRALCGEIENAVIKLTGYAQECQELAKELEAAR